MRYAVIALLVAGIAWWMWQRVERSRAPSERTSERERAVRDREQHRDNDGPPERPSADEAAAERPADLVSLLSMEELRLDTILPLYEVRLKRIEAMADAGAVSQSDLLRARVELALLSLARERGARQSTAFHTLETATRRLEKQSRMLADAGMISVADARRTAALLNAVRNAARWFSSPLRLGAVEGERAPPRRDVPLPDLQDKSGRMSVEELVKRQLGEIDKRELRKQRELLRLLEQCPARDVRILLVSARLGEIEFPEAKSAARQIVDAGTLSRRERDDLEALLGLFDWYAR